MPGIQDILSLLGNYGRDFGAAFDPENYDFELDAILRMLRSGGGGREAGQAPARPPLEEYAGIRSGPSMTPDAPLPDQRRGVGSLTWLGPSSRRAAAGEEFPIYSSDSGGDTAERYRTGGTFNAPELTDERRRQGWGKSSEELYDEGVDLTISSALQEAMLKGDARAVAEIGETVSSSRAARAEAQYRAAMLDAQGEELDWRRENAEAERGHEKEIARMRGNGLLNAAGIQALAAQRGGGGDERNTPSVAAVGENTQPGLASAPRPQHKLVGPDGEVIWAYAEGEPGFGITGGQRIKYRDGRWYWGIVE